MIALPLRKMGIPREDIRMLILFLHREGGVCIDFE
jgi:hypothetical protein